MNNKMSDFTMGVIFITLSMILLAIMEFLPTSCHPAGIMMCTALYAHIDAKWRD